MVGQIRVYCKNIHEHVDITGGDTLQDLYAKIKHRLNFDAICARVNNKTEDMNYPVFGSKQVEFLDKNHPSARRVYTRTLCMILYKAISDLYPGKRLIVEHSILGGYYCNFKHESKTITPDVVQAIKARMREIVDADMPLSRKECRTERLTEKFERQGLNDKVRLLKQSGEIYTTFYKLGDVVDTYYGPLAANTGAITAFDLVPCHGGMLLLGMSKDDPAVPAKMQSQPKLFRAFEEHEAFNCVINVSDVGELNQAIRNKQAGLLITVAEALHNKMFAQIAAQIAERFHQGGARVVLIAGPSSSGKTTSSKRLAVQLMTNYIKPKVIALDNYFVDRALTPRDETGDYDYESIYALDLEQFNKDIEDLIAGKEVKMPTYNFEQGRREYRGETMRLQPDNVLLMEGIHGLNPLLTQQIPEEQKFRVYVSALTTLNIDDHNWISTSDNRLLRRIVRDYKYRGASARDTLARWPSVRRGEEKWIFPSQENADAMFNSSLLFELAVMKSYAEPILRQVPMNVPEYAEAYRLRRFLELFDFLEEQDIPRTSLLREFVGGSTFDY